MKKLLLLVLTAALILSLVGCGGTAPTTTLDPTPATAPVPSPSPASTPSDTPEIIDQPLALYPKGSTSQYLNTASELPEIIFSTTGTENGLGGFIYEFSGEVIETGSIEAEVIIDYIIVKTALGNVAITNPYEYMREREPASFLFTTMEAAADYSFPEKGEEASFVCTYNGYSGSLDMPNFLLGANKFIVESTLEEWGNSEHIIIPSPTVPPYNSPLITYEEFEKIHEGMSYSEVVEIIGGDGELLSEVSLSGTVTKMYTWEGSGSIGANANATFQNDEVVSKAQFGLK